MKNFFIPEDIKAITDSIENRIDKFNNKNIIIGGAFWIFR